MSKRLAELALAEANDDYLQQLWQELVEDELRYYGYTDEEIAEALSVDDHDEKGCEYVPGLGYDCTDEEGKSNHPLQDEAYKVSEIIGRAFGWI